MVHIPREEEARSPCPSHLAQRGITVASQPSLPAVTAIRSEMVGLSFDGDIPSTFPQGPAPTFLASFESLATFAVNCVTRLAC